MVSTFMYHEGLLKFIQSISTHPDDYSGKPGSADIHISPDGNFLYASNRGEENNIAIFRINKSSGKLTLKGFTPSGGKTPRNFIIEPSGKYLLVANQNTNNIVIYKRDKLSGSLTPTGQEISIPKPVCLQMMSK